MLSTEGKITSQDLYFFLVFCFRVLLPLSFRLAVHVFGSRSSLLQLAWPARTTEVFGSTVPSRIISSTPATDGGGGGGGSKPSSTPSSWILSQVTLRLNISLPLQLSGNHNKLTSFFLIQSPNPPLVLGLPWLRLHIPHMDWSTRSIVKTIFCHSPPRWLGSVIPPHSLDVSGKPPEIYLRSCGVLWAMGGIQ